MLQTIPRLVATGLTRRFGGRVVVDDVSLTITAGQNILLDGGATVAGL